MPPSKKVKDINMEIWKNIIGYEDHYQVSNLGRVKALYREFVGKDGKLKKYHERVLKPDLSGTSATKYQRVTLCKDNTTKRFSIHVLVANAYIPNVDNKPYINHMDNDSFNNIATNLEWCTHSENMIHAQKQGRLFDSQSKGGQAIGAKTKDKLLKDIQSNIGKIFGGYKLVALNEYVPKRTTCTFECIHCGVSVVREFKYILRNCPNHKCKVKI